MDSNLHYFPVAPRHDAKALKHSVRYFANAADPEMYKFTDSIRDMFCISDSGGLQVLWAQLKGKRVLFGPMYHTALNGPDFHIVGITDQCRLYRSIGCEKALLLDFPVLAKDNDYDFWRKVSESRKARDQMLAFAKYLCPETRLGAVLQPRSPLEVDRYFVFIHDPRVRFYAYPVRSFRNKPFHAVGNAYVLSFLHDMGVQHVHFLGSSAPAVIFLLAKAASLGMFPRLSFDSATWHTKMNTGLRYIHPETLSNVPPSREPPMHPKENIRLAYEKYPHFFEWMSENLEIREYMLAETWLAMGNILAIDYFKDRVMEAANEGHLEDFVMAFPKYREAGKEVLIQAFRLLEDSVRCGHAYVKDRYSEDLEAL